MSDGYHRKHQSGAEKRKKKVTEEAALKKISGSLEKYLIPAPTTSNNSPICSVLPQENPKIDNDVNVQLEPVLMPNKNEEEGVEIIENIQTGDHESSVNLTHDHINIDDDPITDFDKNRCYDIQNELFKPDPDPAKWIISANLRRYYAENIPEQNITDCDFKEYGKVDGTTNQKRYPSKKYFTRELNNGEKVKREWLIFSKSTGKVYCYLCKLFAKNLDSNQFQAGFDGWHNMKYRVQSHEKSREHFDALQNMIGSRKNKKIDSELLKLQKQISDYWIKVLERVIAAIRFLGERGLAFRGDSHLHNEPSNGNFLGALDFLSEFDPFMKEHIRRYGNPGSGNVSYLSTTICEELIEIMASEVRKKIVAEIKLAKYYGVTIDSTPDISHTDQLSVVFRYVLPDGAVVERFLKFIPIEKHDGAYLFETLKSCIESYGINLSDCRSQSYDNASNMSGTYAGVQARFREINTLAEWVPCAAHSLNLVGSTIVKCCLEAINFFGIVQKIYSFFAGSTQRWLLLTNKFGKSVSVKRLSDTRWSSRHEAVQALSKNYQIIREILLNFTNDDNQAPDYKVEAASLVKKLNLLETAVLCLVWEAVLKQINYASKVIQTQNIEFCVVISMYESLISYLQDIRNKFDEFESKAKMLVPSDVDYKSAVQRPQRENKRRGFDVSLSPKDKFRIETFLPVIDSLLTEMNKRLGAYEMLSGRFGFLTDDSLSHEQIEEKAKQLVHVYHEDLEESFADEFQFFLRTIEKLGIRNSVSGMLEYLIQYNLASNFPNVEIAFRIYLSIMATNAEGERSFSKLTKIKDVHRSTMTQPRLSGLAVLSIESDIMRQIPTAEFIKVFTQKKERKIFSLIESDS